MEDEASYNKIQMRVDKYLLDLMISRKDYVCKKFIRKKDACAIYDISQSEVMKYESEAGALYKRNKMVLIKFDAFNECMTNKLKAESKLRQKKQLNKRIAFLYVRGIMVEKTSIICYVNRA